MCEPVSLRGPQNGALRGSPHPRTEDGGREQTPLPDSGQGLPLKPGLSVQERAAPAPPGSDRPTCSRGCDHCPLPTPLPPRARPCSGVFCARLERSRSGNTDQSVAWLFDSSGNQTRWGGGGPPPGLSRVCSRTRLPAARPLPRGASTPRTPAAPCCHFSRQGTPELRPSPEAPRLGGGSFSSRCFNSFDEESIPCLPFDVVSGSWLGLGCVSNWGQPPAPPEERLTQAVVLGVTFNTSDLTEVAAPSSRRLQPRQSDKGGVRKRLGKAGSRAWSRN